MTAEIIACSISTKVWDLAWINSQPLDMQSDSLRGPAPPDMPKAFKPIALITVSLTL